MGHFCKKICHPELSKIAQSGHTVIKKLEYSDWLIIVMGVFLTNQSSLFWRSIGKLLLNLLMTLTPGVKSLTSEFREKYTNSREDLKDKYLHQNRSLNMSTLK